MRGYYTKFYRRAWDVSNNLLHQQWGFDQNQLIFIYYWEYLDSQSVKSVKWKLNVKKFWLKSYLTPTFAFWTFLLTVFNFCKFGVTRITMQQNKATWSPGANFVDNFDVVSLRLSKSSRVSITLGTRVKATYRYNYSNLVRTQ